MICPVEIALQKGRPFIMRFRQWYLDYHLIMPSMKCILRTYVMLIAFATVAPCQAGSPTELKLKEHNGKWGYVNEAGLFFITPKYFAAQPFVDGLALVVTKKPWTPLGSE